MHTQSAAEYWHRSGSLVHTDPLGEKDADIPESVRIYCFGGTQHGPAADPPGRGIAENLANPGDYKPQLRALLDALDDWVKNDKTPPPSVYPRIDKGTLVGWRQSESGFPALPGVRYPEVIQRPSPRDFGPDFASKGIITVEPPKLLGSLRRESAEKRGRRQRPGNSAAGRGGGSGGDVHRLEPAPPRCGSRGRTGEPDGFVHPVRENEGRGESSSAIHGRRWKSATVPLRSTNVAYRLTAMRW